MDSNTKQKLRHRKQKPKGQPETPSQPLERQPETPSQQPKKQQSVSAEQSSLSGMLRMLQCGRKGIQYCFHVHS